MRRRKGRRAFKLHAHFELLKGVPASMGLTDAAGHLAASLRPPGHGPRVSELFAWSGPPAAAVAGPRPAMWPPAAAAAGVVTDRVVMLGCDSAAHRPAEPVWSWPPSPTPSGPAGRAAAAPGSPT